MCSVMHCSYFSVHNIGASDEWKCPDNTCISRDWLCDGDDDCNDNTDELPSNCLLSSRWFLNMYNHGKLSV